MSTVYRIMVGWHTKLNIIFVVSIEQIIKRLDAIHLTGDAL